MAKSKKTTKIVWSTDGNNISAYIDCIGCKPDRISIKMSKNCFGTLKQTKEEMVKQLFAQADRKYLLAGIPNPFKD